MLLFIDETECEDFFIVAGLLVDSKETIDFIYKKFKNKLKGMKLSNKAKQQIFLEFKAVLLKVRSNTSWLALRIQNERNFVAYVILNM